MENKNSIINQIQEFRIKPGEYWSEQADTDLFLNAVKIHRLGKVYKPSFDSRYTGENQRLVLCHKNGLAIMVWERKSSPEGQDRMECTIFINKSFHLNSDMILEGMKMVTTQWPGLRLVVQVEPSRITSETGLCFEICGWRHTGENRLGQNIYEFLPPE